MNEKFSQKEKEIFKLNKQLSSQKKESKQKRISIRIENDDHINKFDSRNYEKAKVIFKLIQNYFVRSEKRELTFNLKEEISRFEKDIES